MNVCICVSVVYVCAYMCERVLWACGSVCECVSMVYGCATVCTSVRVYVSG